jgi:hypothetical protein
LRIDSLKIASTRAKADQPPKNRIVTGGPEFVLRSLTA